MNRELPDVQAGFRKGRGIKVDICNVCWIIEKARVLEKHLLYWLHQLLYGSQQLWKSLKEMGIPDHLTCLLRSLYAGQEATVRTGHGTMDWFQIGKWVWQGCILSPCLFNLYADFYTSCEMLGWMKHKLESKVLGEISITSEIPPLWKKAKN